MTENLSLKSHFKLIHDGFIDTCNTFTFESRQSRLALKTAVSCVIAVFLTNYLRIPHAFWAGISTIIMMQPHARASLKKGWMRAGGACMGCFLSLFFTAFSVQDPLFFSVGIFLIASSAFYLGNRSKIGYFWSYMLGHIALISMISVMNPYNTYPIHIAFYRASAVTIGVLVSLAINVVFWPEKPTTEELEKERLTTPASEKSPLDFFILKLINKTVFIHKKTLAYSIRGGLGILMVFWLWLILEIPGGGLNMSVSVITLFQQDLINTFHKGLLRMSGCIVGGALGLFCVSLGIESPILMAAILLFVIYPFAYIWGGKDTVAYLGAQGAIAFIIAVFPASGPANELAPVIERLTGITLAITCIWSLNLIPMFFLKEK